MASSEATVVGNVVVIPAGHPAWRVLVVALENVHNTAGRNGTVPDSRLTTLLQQLAALSVEPSQVSPVSRTQPQFDRPGFAASGLTLLRSVENGAASAVLGMNTADAAALAGISRQAVRKAARAGRLAGRRTDLGWQFSEAAVSAWRDKRSARIETGEAK